MIKGKLIASRVRFNDLLNCDSWKERQHTHDCISIVGFNICVVMLAFNELLDVSGYNYFNAFSNLLANSSKVIPIA